MAKKRFFRDAAPSSNKKVKYYTEDQVLEMRTWEEDEVWAIKRYFDSVRSHEMTSNPTIGFTTKDDLNEQLKDILIQYYLYELIQGAGHHLDFAWGKSGKDFDALYKAFCDVWCAFEY